MLVDPHARPGRVHDRPTGSEGIGHVDVVERRASERDLLGGRPPKVEGVRQAVEVAEPRAAHETDQVEGLGRRLDEVARVRLDDDVDALPLEDGQQRLERSQERGTAGVGLGGVPGELAVDARASQLDGRGDPVAPPVDRPLAHLLVLARPGLDDRDRGDVDLGVRGPAAQLPQGRGIRGHGLEGTDEVVTIPELDVLVAGRGRGLDRLRGWATRSASRGRARASCGPALHVTIGDDDGLAGDPPLAQRDQRGVDVLERPAADLRQTHVPVRGELEAAFEVLAATRADAADGELLAGHDRQVDVRDTRVAGQDVAALGTERLEPGRQHVRRARAVDDDVDRRGGLGDRSPRPRGRCGRGPHGGGRCAARPAR